MSTPEQNRQLNERIGRAKDDLLAALRFAEQSDATKGTLYALNRLVGQTGKLQATLRGEARP